MRETDGHRERETACRLWQATESSKMICGDRQRERERARDRVKERERERARDRVKKRERERERERANESINCHFIQHQAWHV